MINSKIITITPEMANSFLERNTRNRPVRKQVVNFLKNAILRGEWVTTHQGVAFDEHGVLIDGQHRLLAVVAANKPVEAMVTWGVSRAAFSVIDTITPRKISDLLDISPACGQVVNLLASICYYGNLTSKITAHQARPIANIISPLHEKISKTTFKRVSTAAIRSYVCYLMMETEYGDYANNLYRSLVTRSFKDLPPVGDAFIKFVMRNGLDRKRSATDQQLNAFGCADFLFSPKNKDKTKIVARDGNAVIKEIQDSLKLFFVDDNASIVKENETQSPVKHLLEGCRV